MTEAVPQVKGPRLGKGFNSLGGRLNGGLRKIGEDEGGHSPPTNGRRGRLCAFSNPGLVPVPGFAPGT
jgi:hypothetical protein